MKNRYQIRTSMKNWYQMMTCENFVSKLTSLKSWYQILTPVKYRYQIITDVKNCYLIVTDVSDKTVKLRKWNRMQNAADLGVFYQCEEYTCMLYEILFRVYFSQSVRYWNEICAVFVPIFHVLRGIGTNIHAVYLSISTDDKGHGWREKS